MVEGEVHRVWPMSACGATHTCGAGAYTGVSAVDWTQPQAQPAVDADEAHTRHLLALSMHEMGSVAGREGR